jgi:acyl-CoA thioester hydrolase
LQGRDARLRQTLHKGNPHDTDPAFADAVAGGLRCAFGAADLMAHLHAVRVYYEDTDLAGIVYYANHLRFIERARTEWIRALGVDQVALRSDQGIVFAVRRVEADYLAPAHFDDQLQVRTTLQALGGARIVLEQDIWRGETRLFAGIVTLVAIGADGGPVRLPQALRVHLTGE